MKIGVDARSLTKKEYTGISRSIYEILKVWEKKYPQHEFYLLSGKKIYFDEDAPSNWHIIDTPFVIDSGKLWYQFKLPSLIKELDLDVFWGSNFFLPRKVKKCSYYVTIYDLANFKFKNIGKSGMAVKLKLFTKSACKKSKKVFAISYATKKDIHELLGIEEEKIVVSYCGGLPADYEKRTYIDEAMVRDELKFDCQFFLFISTIEPRKNIVTIIKGFEEFCKRDKRKYKLVLAGKKGWKCDDVFEAAENSPFADDIILPGFINDDEKEYLLTHASALVYPSLYEGFGIPILEGFSYNLPVITSMVSSMPEVAGDAAFYIDEPHDYLSLADKMSECVMISGDDRSRLIGKMNNRLSLFSWEKNGDEMMNTFLRDIEEV